MTAFTRTSIASGKTRTLDLPITQEAWEQHLRDRTLIQQAFPQLTPGQREFLMTGITGEEWDELFKEDAEEEDDDAPL